MNMSGHEGSLKWQESEETNGPGQAQAQDTGKGKSSTKRHEKLVNIRESKQTHDKDC